MKKTVLVFGLLSGAVSAVLMTGTMLFADRIGFDRGLIIGYTTIVLSFLLVFFGIRSYRENVGGGTISFGRAFAVGILITLISSLCYVIAWEILYYNFLPDFCEKYASYLAEKARASGATQAVIDAQVQQVKDMKVILDNPLKNGLATFIEPFPVGLLITLISAAILRRKRSSGSLPAPEAVAGS